MAAVMTYSSLVVDIPNYAERMDAKFLAQIPEFVSLAENRIATDMKQQGFQAVVTGAFTPGGPGAVLAKPAFWRETLAFSYQDPIAGWVTLRLRSLEYLKAFWPSQGLTGSPKFYADYNATNFLLAPSPAAALPFELSYYARLQPLDPDNQANWMTNNMPQVLLYACMLEASIWAKNANEIAKWQAQYGDQKGSVLNENSERLTDRNEVVVRG